MKPLVQPDPRGYEIRIWYSAEKGDECFIAQVIEWSEWGERHGRGSGSRLGRSVVAVERCGK